tara:strand:+ start:213 stop:368 length:156 start_codon:yes stop_codon:yes gene_type:complete
MEAIWISETRPLLPVIAYWQLQFGSRQQRPKGREVGEPIPKIVGDRSLIKA